MIRARSAWLLQWAILGAVTCGASWPIRADWREFRGGEQSEAVEESSLPVSWSETENIAWTAELPGRGVSGPIVIGNRIVVTASSGLRGDRLHVLCIDASDGKRLWQREFWATGSTLCHPKMSTAAPTPASDGTRIFAFFSTNDVICLDLDGNLQWLRGLTYDYPDAYNEIGMSSSPVIAGESLILQVETTGDSFAVGLDVWDGSERWKVERPRAANWTSPIVLRNRGANRDVVVLQSGQGLSAYDPATGQSLWEFRQGCAIIPTAAGAGDRLFVPSNGITALRVPGDCTRPEVLWRANRGESTPSPLYYRNQVFTVNGAGVLESIDAASGTSLWRLRLTGPFSASPVAAGGHLYLFNEQGESAVVKPGLKQGEIVGASQLGETILCTPAIANGALYVRSDRHLWKLAKP